MNHDHDFDDLDEYDDDEEIIIISKSQQKRDSQSLQALGRELFELPASKLARVPLPEKIAEALQLAHSIDARAGRKRQMQYIGKLLRNCDAEPIIAAVEAIKQEHLQANARFHRLEQWRDRLLEEGDSALAALLDEYPQLDRQHLRQLLRNAMKERKENKPPKAARELFKYLRENEVV